MITPRAQVKRLAVISNLDPDIPRFLRGDPQRLRQVLLNLLNNAVKFTEKGNVTLHAALVRNSDGWNRLRFTVSDTGIGISDQARKRLFEPFMQSDSSTTRKYGGTGLCLAIFKIVNLMG
ncbi:MAG TPA: ATP-binding protein, partial [Verrucomicrobiae bacterium]|nr:ATP-binding protein [Verrucomicrobiae bacterium]